MKFESASNCLRQLQNKWTMLQGSRWCIYVFLLLSTLSEIFLAKRDFEDIWTRERLIENKNVTVVRVGRGGYLLKDGSKFLFPDRYTLNTMGYQLIHMPFVSHAYINGFPEGKPEMKTLWDHHSNEDYLKLGASPFIVETKKVFNLMNPSMIYINHGGVVGVVISWRNTDNTFRVVWLNIHSGYDGSNGLDIESDLAKLSAISINKNDSLPHIELHGEDPRLQVLNKDKPNQKLYVVFARRYRKKPELQMTFTELILTDKTIKYDDIVDISFRKERDDEDQKNWSPLEFENQMLFISAADPQRIVENITPNPKKSWIGEGKTKAITSVEGDGIIWSYGEIRGGTPALLIDDNTFLTFFHCSRHPPPTGNVLKTYSMGAYTFSSKPPFGINSISTVPIIHPTMYTGQWAYLPLSFYHIDYIVFPMSFVVTKDNKFLYLFYGKQDAEGWVAKLDLKGFLSSLKPVTSSIFVNKTKGCWPPSQCPTPTP